MCLADLHGRQLIQALAALGLLACGLDTKAQTPAPVEGTNDATGTVVPTPMPMPEADTGKPSPGTSKSATAPYFAVQGVDDGVDHFPMKETKVDVKLNGVIATVHVHQHYRNEGTKPINAKYVFPGSTRAAMGAMSMTVGNRRIKAQIKEKEQAQKLFEAAKAAGQSASLLSQKRPNVFSMDVANIGVGAEVDVDMDYTEFLASTEGEYEFVYPGVVGPRYGGDANRTDAPTDWIRSPYLHAGSSSPVGFDVSVQLDTPFALNDLTSTSHRIVAQWNGPKSVKVLLDEPKQGAGNRDFILHYRLQGATILSGLTRFTAYGENYFLLQAEPPQRATNASIPPREYVFVVDVSGSMDGFPLATARSLITRLLGTLRAEDRFNIVFFAGGSEVLAPASLQATPDNLQLATDMLSRISGGGGTELLPALEKAMAMPHDEGRSRSLVVITDGYVSAEDTAFKLLDDQLGHSNLYAFGIGTSVNRYLIEGLAKVGHAESFVVTNEADAARESERFRQYVSAPVLTDIGVSGRNVEIYDVEPRSQPDLLARRAVLVIGKYRNPRANAAVELSGMTGTGRQLWAFSLSNADTDGSLPVLWARKKLERLYLAPHSTGEAREQIKALGLKYSLLTSATSFIGVDETLPTGDVGQGVDVKQPQPLPEGVGDAAVGDSLTPAPEPEWTVLVAWCVLLLGLRHARNPYRKPAMAGERGG